MKTELPKVSRVSIRKAMDCIMECYDARQVVIYQHPKLIVKATRQFKHDGRLTRSTFLVTVGAPAYRQRQFIKACLKAGEKFPVGKPQIRWWPKARKVTP